MSFSFKLIENFLQSLRHHLDEEDVSGGGHEGLAEDEEKLNDDAAEDAVGFPDTLDRLDEGSSAPRKWKAAKVKKKEKLGARAVALLGCCSVLSRY